MSTHATRDAFHAWAEAKGYDVAHTYDTERSRWVYLSPMTADLWGCWQAASIRTERSEREDAEILQAVIREMPNKKQDGNAPGHAHDVPGIWDWDNGAKAGKPCAWCLTWKKFTELAARHQGAQHG